MPWPFGGGLQEALWFLHALEDSLLHWLSSGIVGALAWGWTWTIYSNSFGMELKSLGRTYVPPVVARYIFWQSLRVASFASLATHVTVDYWPVLMRLLESW